MKDAVEHRGISFLARKPSPLRSNSANKLTAALAFHLVLAVVWLVSQLFGLAARRSSLYAEEAVRLFVQSLLFAAAGYILLDERIPHRIRSTPVSGRSCGSTG